MSTTLRTVEKVLSGEVQYLARSLLNIQPGDVVYLSASSTVYGRFTVGVVFITPRKHLNELLDKLNLPKVRVRGSYVTLIEVKNPTPCRAELTDLGLRPAPLRRLNSGEERMLNSLCQQLS